MKGVLFLIVILIIASVAGFFVLSGQYSSYQEQNNQQVNTEQSNSTVNNNPREMLGNDCEGTKIKFDYPPVNLDKTLVFLPLGLMTGSHVTPIDHHYFQNFNNDQPDIEVYSPGKGIITSIQHMPGAINGEDYRLVIDHTCGVSSIYIHIQLLSDKIKEQVLDKEYISVKIPVEAGEIIGYYEKNVDYNLVDENIVLSGFVIPEHYRAEPWKIHVPSNTYGYFNEPVRSKLIEKSLRTTEPISGKIDYDIDGKLVGNWFLEGTDGYSGDYTNNERYWLGHLSIVYDAYDTDTIILSIANYEGEDSKQFIVNGNQPNPVLVSVDSGIVKYELLNYDYVDSKGIFWYRMSLVRGLTVVPRGDSVGVVLIQLVEDRKIKFEVFPGKTGNMIDSFTNNAKIYER